VIARRASPADADLVTGIITLAFAADPLWSGAMSRADRSIDHHFVFWKRFVDGALRYPWVWVAGGGEATSVWIPPGQSEMSYEQEHELVDLAREHLGPGAETYLELLRRFEAAHPRDEPHYYLTLLGTHPAHRGRGIGMGLLAHDLAMIDAEHQPAYLESSNPANDERYKKLGFEPIGTITPPHGGLTVATMWRAAR